MDETTGYRMDPMTGWIGFLIVTET